MNDIRPKIKIAKTSDDIIIEIISIAGVLAQLGLLLYLIFSKESPFNFAVWITAIVIILYAALSILGKYPEKLNYAVKITEQNAQTQYTLAIRFLRLLKLFIVWMFVVISSNQAGIFFNHQEGLTIVFLLLALIIFLLIKYISNSIANG